MSIARFLATSAPAVVVAALLSGCTGNEMTMNDAPRRADVSGEYYDWTITHRPERPYIHPYHQTLTYKIYLAQKTADGGHVVLTFEQTLEVVRKVDNLTRGVPKIAYLVGWQYDGHDSKYPAFFEANERLKRPQDATALDSLRWLMDAGFDYNTTVSLHINLYDAYPTSPLWDLYVERDVIARGYEGELLHGETFDGETSYGISYTREWEEGLTQQRLDKLLSLLPVERAGTLHVDAYHSRRPESMNTSEGREKYPDGCLSPYHKIPVESDIAVQRKVFRYLRDRGVDVTSECSAYYLRKDPFVGLQPMAWHFAGLDPMQVPASLYCGGASGEDMDVFGRSMQGEGRIRNDPESLTGFLKDFCLLTLPWYYLNRLDRLSYEDGVVTFSEGVTSDADGVRQGDRLLYDRKAGDVFMPALWRDSREIIAYSANGCQNHTWRLPPDWSDVSRVRISTITINGLQPLCEQDVVDGQVALTLAADQGAAVQPLQAAVDE